MPMLEIDARALVVSTTLATTVLLRRPFERGQCQGPEPIEVVPQRVDARGVELVNPPVTLGTIDHQPRIFQNAEMLGDGGPADGEFAGQLAHRPRAVEEPLEDRPPGRITQGIQLLRMLVSNH